MSLESLNGVEGFISKYLVSLNDKLREMELSVKDEGVKKVLRASWNNISKCSAWMLLNYRANMGTRENIEPVPYCMIAFSCRLLMETSADILYLFNNKDQIDAFLEEFGELQNDLDDSLKKIRNTDYNYNFSLRDKTIVRIKECFGDDGVAHYNSLCWSTHFNYVGYQIEKNELLTYKLRIYNLLYILESLNKLVSCIEIINIKTESMENLVEESRKHAQMIKDYLEAKNV